MKDLPEVPGQILGCFRAFVYTSVLSRLELIAGAATVMGIFEFDRFRFRPDSGDLETYASEERRKQARAPEETVMLPRIDGAVLHFFLTHPREILSGDTIVRESWPENQQNGANPTQAVARVRKHLGDSQEKKLIRTLHRRGYQLTCGVRCTSSDGPGKRGIRDEPSGSDLVKEAARFLQENVRSWNGKTGWTHHLDEKLVTSVASSFGLRILSLLPPPKRREVSALAHRVAESILSDACDDHLWRTSSGAAPLESSAWVVIGLMGWLSPDQLSSHVRALENLVVRELEGSPRTLSITLSIHALLAGRKGSPVLTDCVHRLWNSASEGNRGRPVSWGLTLEHDARARESVAPTVAHTARAVLALARSKRLLGDLVGPKDVAFADVTSWLLSQHQWQGALEDITEIHEGKSNKVVSVRHYGNAWALRALMAVGADPGNRRVEDAARKILEGRAGSVWSWAGGKPIWATYDALAAIRDWQGRGAYAPSKR